MATRFPARCGRISPRRAPLPSANEALTPSKAQVERFRADLTPLFDVERDRLLVAVSGGPDSLALLLLAHALLGERCLAATVDHGLRPESADEAAFVAEICASRGIAHRVLSGAFPPRAGRTANLSARARLLRYQCLDAERARVDAMAIATAHHADDQLETMVMRLNRGAGLSGLAGVRAAGETVIRPLLGWRRNELEEIVVECGIDPVRDPSNSDDRFDRARIRKAIGDVDWLDATGWATSAGALADSEAALEWTTQRLIAERCRFGDGEASLDAVDLPFELRRRLTTHCLAHVDPAIDPRGSEVARLVERLNSAIGSTLGNVQVVLVSDGAWHFRKAPARRSH